MINKLKWCNEQLVKFQDRTGTDVSYMVGLVGAATSDVDEARKLAHKLGISGLNEYQLNLCNRIMDLLGRV